MKLKILTCHFCQCSLGIAVEIAYSLILALTAFILSALIILLR